jgi:hypothetical protein
MNRYFTKAIFLCAFSIVAAFGEQEIKIRPAKPTHYFYTPMAAVNPPYCFVASLHELSYSFPDRLQVQASLFDNIGRINFGAKYGINRSLAVGAGLASSLIHIGDGTHGIPSWAPARFGLYLCCNIIDTRIFEAAITPHMQLFDHNSLGCDFGCMWSPSKLWSIIGEVGTSIDVTDNSFYFNTDGGLRIHPPSLPFLYFDGGIDVQEFKINRPHASTSVSIYIDAIFAMVTR